jgi:hypothetical protein
MGCGCNEQHNSNCFCQCENLDVPQGPTGLQGIQGATGAAGAAGAAGTDGADAFNAQLSSYAVAINLADTTGAFAGIPPVAYKYYNNTITTVFSLTEGGVPVAIDVANMALTYGGEVNLATITNVAGGIELNLVRGLNTPTSNYGYVDMTYTHGTLTFVKRFNVVYVQDGVDFQVGIDDTSYITDPQEGMELLTKSGQMMRYQGGAWIQTFDIHQTTTKAVVLTGASYTLNLTATDERIISLTGSGTVNNNIAINLPVAGCAAGTEFKVLYGANMTAGTGAITIFGVVIDPLLYSEQLTINAIYNGATWVVNIGLSEAAIKAFHNLYFVLYPTAGAGTVSYTAPINYYGTVTYIVHYPTTADKTISIYLGWTEGQTGRLTTRIVDVIIFDAPDIVELDAVAQKVTVVGQIGSGGGGVWETINLVDYYDSAGLLGNIGYLLHRQTGVTNTKSFAVMKDYRFVLNYEDVYFQRQVTNRNIYVVPAVPDGNLYLDNEAV